MMIQWRKNSPFQQIMMGQLDIRKINNEVNKDLTPYKITSMFIKDLNVRAKL